MFVHHVGNVITLAVLARVTPSHYYRQNRRGLHSSGEATLRVAAEKMGKNSNGFSLALLAETNETASFGTLRVVEKTG